MKKLLWAGSVALLASFGSRAQTWQYESGTTFNLTGCTRLTGSVVECSFNVRNNVQDRPLVFGRWGMTIAAQGGAAISAARMTLDGQPFPFDQATYLRRGQNYTLRVQFNNFAASSIRALTIDDGGTRTNIAIRAGAPVPAGTWKPEWRWAAFSGQPRRILIHGCYGDSQKANCYVTVSDPDAKKRPLSDANVSVIDDSVLMTYANQPVSGGQVRLKVGDLVIGVPVR